MTYLHFVMFFWVNIELFVKIYDFGDYFAFGKHTMRDRVMKNWFKNIIILGMAPQSDFVIICANHFTSAIYVFKIR